MSERPRVEHVIDGVRWTLYDAWRSPSGLGLGYFVGGERGPDRRVPLPPDMDVADLDAAGFRELLNAAAELTVTERRIAGPGGRPWLAQAYGPVWHAGGTAREAIGVRLRRLDAEAPSVVVPGVALSGASDEELAAAIGQPDQ